MQSISKLKEALQLGMSVVSESWSYKTKDWVTCIHAEDVNNDGNLEILVGSRDGRIHVLNIQGTCLWERVIGHKRGVSAIVGLAPHECRVYSVKILVGVQDGKVYALDADGQIIRNDEQQAYFLDENKWAYDKKQERETFWHCSGYEIRNLSIAPGTQSQVIIDSEDHYIYTLDYCTGRSQQTFFVGTATVQATFSFDINKDGQVETLVSTSDQHLYILDSTGKLLRTQDVQGQVHLIHAADIDNDGRIEILLGIDGRILLCLRCDDQLYFEPLWRIPLPARSLGLSVIDVDGDGENEILVGAEDKHLYVLNAQGKEVWRYFLRRRISSLYARDVDNDGQVEVLVGFQDNEDSRIQILRLRMIKSLNETIQTCYQKLGSPPVMTLEGLSSAQRVLLRDLVTRSGIRSASLKRVEGLIDGRRYREALLEALTLERQKVEQLWRKELLGFVNTLCIDTIVNERGLEIVAGTSKENIHVFNSASQEIWFLPYEKQIASMQTGYLTLGKRSQVVVCSNDGDINVFARRNEDRTGSSSHADLQTTLKIDEQLLSLYVNANGKREPIEVLIGSKNKKIYVYGRDFQPLWTIDTPQGIRAVSARVTNDNDTPMIVAGSDGDVEHRVYAYAKYSTSTLWDYKTKGRVEALCIREIDKKGNIEVIVGSQDRNVHVLDQHGKLKWRYLLPDFVQAVAVYDIDRDGHFEIFAGCKDGYLYVLSHDGELLWTYQTYGSVLAVCVEDIDNDRQVEIIIGSENQLEVVRIVEQRQVQLLIDECWQALKREKPFDALIDELQKGSQQLLRAFALRKMAEEQTLSQNDFSVFEPFSKDGSVEVKKALIHALVTNYHVHPQYAQRILSQLVIDPEPEVRLALVEQISNLMRKYGKPGKEDYWEDGFRFMQLFMRNDDRVVRRAVMRELYALEDFFGRTGRKRRIFELLLQGLIEPESPTVQASEWVRQEAARTMAHFLDQNHNDLLIYLNNLIVKDVRRKILHLIAYHSQTSFIQHIFTDLGTLVHSLRDAKVFQHLEMVVQALQETRGLRYGEETLTIYKELALLANLHTLEEVAAYQCVLKDDPSISSKNIHFPSAVSTLNQLNRITRSLRQYLRRDDIRDRVNSLLEANRSIEHVRKFAEEMYSAIALGEPLSKLPDYHVIKLLLERWQSLVNNELVQLRGNPELKAEIQPRQALFEDQVVVRLLLRNIGNSTADYVSVDLLHGDDFEAVEKTSFQTDCIFAQNDVVVEFTIKPRTTTPNLDFDILYVDTENLEKKITFHDQLELYTSQAQKTFTPIPNPYSTGVPTRAMCYGRESDLEYLQRVLTQTSGGSFFILYGQRRSGKTTLLFQLADTDILEPHIPVRIDMQNESYKISERKLFYDIAFYIKEALQERGIHLRLSAERQFKENPSFALNRFLDMVEKRLDERKLILLIDEFEVLEDQVTKKALPSEIFEYLRSLVQDYQNIRFLLSGVHTIQQLTTEYWSVFFNLANHYRLSRLNEQGASNLITLPVRDYLDFDPYAISKIRLLANDQPFLIHLICRSLVDYCNEKKKKFVTINDVNTVLNTIIESGHNHFQWIWTQSSREERYVLAVMADLDAEEGRLLSQVEIEVKYNLHPSIPCKGINFATILDKLVERDIVEKVADWANEGVSSYVRYRLSVGLVREWLRKNKSVSQVRYEEAVSR